jgi:hypothetical protein
VSPPSDALEIGIAADIRHGHQDFGKALALGFP